LVVSANLNLDVEQAADLMREIGEIFNNVCLVGTGADLSRMSECTMTLHGAQKTAQKERLAKDPSAEAGPGIYDQCFMSSLGPALPVLQEKRVKLAVNAGASDPHLLAKDVKARVQELGLSLKVAWVEGDEVTVQMNQLRKSGESFNSLDTGKPLSEWGHEPVCAQ
jgi:hypothetical protein